MNNRSVLRTLSLIFVLGVASATAATVCYVNPAAKADAIVCGPSTTGGSGDVVGPASAVDNTVVVFDSTTGKLIKAGSGCTIGTNIITCTGGLQAGDGTAQSGLILPELAANGTNDFRIYGASSQSADGCLIYSGALASGDSWRGSATTATVDGKTCRVMETYTPGGGGGSLSIASSGGCFLADGCAALGSTTLAAFSGTASRVYVHQVVVPYTISLAKIAVYVYDGGTAGQAAVFGIYADNGANAPTGAPLCSINVLDWSASRFVNTTTSSCSNLSPGVYWIAQAAEVTTMRARVTDANITAFKGNVGPRFAYCANTASGSGGTLALPATCGALSAEGNFPAVVLFANQ